MIGYLRVSTEEQAASGAGLDAQRIALEREAQRRDWSLELVTDAGVSAKDLDRPGIRVALEQLASGAADGIAVAKLDRLSRSLFDFALLMERSRKQGWSLVALDVGVDTSTPNGELLATVIAAMAQWERRLIAQRTKEALAARRAAGVRLGRPRAVPDEVVGRILGLRQAGLSNAAIARVLNTEGVATAQGGRRWYHSSVGAVLAYAS